MEPEYYSPPDDHERQMRAAWRWLALFFGGLTAAVIVFVLNAHRIAVYLPFSVEQRFVRPYEAMSDYFLDEPTEEQAEVRQYLQGLADELSRAMGLPEKMEVRLHYLEGDQINAFATLGGHVFVFRGLIAELPDENSLAMVIAHEIAHVRNRDPVVSLGRGIALQMLYSSLTGNYGASGDVAAFGGNLGLLHFSREQEAAADELAVAAIVDVYGHSTGSSTLFRRVLDRGDSSGAALPAWLATHPNLQDRIDRLDRYAANRGWQSGAGEPIPPGIREIVAVAGSGED